MSYRIYLSILAIITCIAITIYFLQHSGVSSSTLQNSEVHAKEFVDKFRNEMEKQYGKAYQAEIKQAIDIYINSYNAIMNIYINTYSDSDKIDLKNQLYKELDEVISISKKEGKSNPLAIMKEVLTQVFNLDPHTLWMASQLLKQNLFDKEITVGASFALNKKNQMVVTKVDTAEDTPFQVGDILIALDGVKFGLSSLKRLNQMVVEHQVGDLLTFTIERDSIQKDYQVKLGLKNLNKVYYKVIDNKYLYIKLYLFNITTDIEILKAFQESKVNSLKGIILDLRDNLGGLLPSAKIIADYFLSNKNIIKEISNREDASSTNANFSFETQTFKYTIVNQDIPMVVLTNSNSASASELLSGALSLNGRATLMGDTTFGKWSVQVIEEVGEGIFFPITVSLFHVPFQGKNITFQGLGVTPDIQINSTNNNEEVFRESFDDTYIRPKKENTIVRTPKVILDDTKCPNIENNAPSIKSNDPVLGCALLFLNNGANVVDFETSISKK